MSNRGAKMAIKCSLRTNRVPRAFNHIGTEMKGLTWAGRSPGPSRLHPNVAKGPGDEVVFVRHFAKFVPTKPKTLCNWMLPARGFRL